MLTGVDVLLPPLDLQLVHPEYGTVSNILDFVEASGSDEHVRFINALTTNLTYFFREQHHFSILSDHLLQAYEDQGKERPLTVWSAACSTGEEPYSIAMAG